MDDPHFLTYFRAVVHDATRGLRGMLRAASGGRERDALYRAYKSSADAQMAALQRALEHCDAATKCRSVVEIDVAPNQQAEAIAALHAHIKAASSYLDVARDAGSNDDVTDDLLPLPEDPEERATIQRNRAAAAVTLAVAGESAAASRLVGAPKPRT